MTKFAQNNISHHSQTKSPKGGVERGINNLIMDAMYKFFSKLASIGSDKYLHMIAGLIVSMVVCRGLHAIDACLLLSLVPAFIVMFGKESIDYYFRKEPFDWHDVVAGMTGALLGIGLYLL